MTTEHDARTRTIVSWLREDAHENAERVLLAALNEVDTTHQRRSGWLARRFSDMHGSAKVLVAAAAVVAVILVGISLVPRASGPGGQPPSPTPGPTSTPSAETAVVPRLPDSGPIEAGTYVLGDTPIRITVPPGWDAQANGFDIRKNLGQPDEVGLSSSQETRVYDDACATDGRPRQTGPTADDLLAALMSQENSDSSEPLETTVGGRVTTRIEITIPEGLELSSCTGGVLRIWEDTAGHLTLGGTETAPIYVVRSASGRIVFGTGHGPAATAADLAELDAIIGSMVIPE
jgi:hypothetical protein